MDKITSFIEFLNLQRRKKKMKMLENGKIKVGGAKVDLSPFIEKTLEFTVVQNLSSIISKEDVTIEERQSSNVIINLMNPVQCALTQALRKAYPVNATVYSYAEHTVRKTDTMDTPTIIITMKKKDCDKLYLDDSNLGIILKTSTLTPVYKKMKKRWIELNTSNEKTDEVNIFYVPNVTVFLDKKGKLLKAPLLINVLLLALPNAKYVVGDDNNMNDDAKIATLVADIFDAVIKLGCKNIVIDPFEFMYFRKNPSATSDAFLEITDTSRVKNSVDKVSFAIEKDNMYAIFNGENIRLSRNN